MNRLTDHDASFVFSCLPTVVQSSAEVEHELLSLSSDSWTDAQQPNPCTTTVIQGFAELVSLPLDDPIEDFSDEDMATGSMAVAGRCPDMDIAALLDRAADRFSACMDTKVDSMVDRWPCDGQIVCAGPLRGPATLSWWRGLVPVRIRT